MGAEPISVYSKMGISKLWNETTYPIQIDILAHMFFMRKGRIKKSQWARYGCCAQKIKWRKWALQKILKYGQRPIFGLGITLISIYVRFIFLCFYLTKLLAVFALKGVYESKE